MTPRAILFDLDGTLIDQFKAIHKSFSLTLEKMGYPAPEFETVKRAVGGASETTMSKLIGPEKAKEAVQILRPIFEKEMFNGLEPLEGSIEILSACSKHGIKTGVLTNKYGPHARKACSFLGFDKYLEFTIGVSDTEWKKPESLLSQYALKKIGQSSQDTLYIGDSPYDYKTAVNAGMDCLLVSTGTHSHNELTKLASGLKVENNLLSLLPLIGIS